MATRTVEERVTFLEDKVAENALGIEGLRRAVADLATRMDEGFAAVARRFEVVDQRFEAIDQRFEAIDRRFAAIDRRFEVMDQRFQAMDQRIDALHERLDRGFQRMFGAQIAILIAVLGALTTLLAAVLRG